jgi:hypothetical protein
MLEINAFPGSPNPNASIKKVLRQILKFPKVQRIFVTEMASINDKKNQCLPPNSAGKQRNKLNI